MLRRRALTLLTQSRRLCTAADLPALISTAKIVKEPLPPEAPREITPEEEKHRKRMRLLFKDYDEWPEERKEQFFKNDK